jgi:hypothetical protein
MSRHTLVWLCGAALVLSLASPVAAAPRPAKPAPLKWGVVVVSGGKEWPMAARILADLEGALKAMGARQVFYEDPWPEEPTEQLRGLLKRIRKGRKLISKLQAQKAVEVLEGVVGDLRPLIVQRGGTPGLLKRYQQVHTYLGVAQQANADAAASVAAYTTAINLAPTRKLSEKYFSEEVIEGYEKLKQNLKATQILRVTTDEPAIVFVDGRVVGVSPLEVKGVTPGEHLVELRRRGFQRISRFVSVDVRLGGSLEVRLVKTSVHDDGQKVNQTVAAELRRGSRPGKALVALAAELKVNRLLVLRASLDDGEVSVLQADEGKFLKRVRRINALPGQPPGKIIAEALKQPTPVSDLQAGTSTGGGGGSCEDNDDCPGGRCVDGRCVSETPVYKKWWFWVAIVVSAGAVAGGGAALGLMPRQPVINIRIGNR